MSRDIPKRAKVENKSFVQLQTIPEKDFKPKLKQRKYLNHKNPQNRHQP